LTDEPELPWKAAPVDWGCHAYSAGQNDKWCREMGTVDNVEYRFTVGGGCGPTGKECWCCKRASRTAEFAFNGKIPIYFGDTRRPLGVYTLSGVPGKSFNNVAGGITWDYSTGFKAKLHMYKPLVNYWAAREPSKMLIIIDSDVGYGGCSDEEIMARYERIVKSSGGATIVMGAEPWQNPPITGALEREKGLLPRRDRMFAEFGLRLDDLRQYIPKHDALAGPADDYAFLNSGFVMGPAGDLAEAFACDEKLGWWPRRNIWDDQRGFHQCMLARPGTITIDYTSTLVATMFGMHANMMEFKDMQVHNRFGNVTQCFIHTDCDNCDTPYVWAKWLTWVARSFRAVPR